MSSCDYLSDFSARMACEQKKMSSFRLTAPTLGSTTSGGSSGTGLSTMPSSEKSSFWTMDNISNLTSGLVNLATTGVNIWGQVENVNLQKKLAESQIKQGQQTITPINSATTQQGLTAAQLQALQSQQAQTAALQSLSAAPTTSKDTNKIAMIALVGIGGLIAVVLVTNLINKGHGTVAK